MNAWKFFSTTLIFIFSLNGFAITTQGHQMMVSGPSSYAVEIGQEIFKKGGNVVDVAVAVGFTLAVTTPYYGSLGGGGFALVKMGDDAPIALDFREVAPNKTSPTFYTEDTKRSPEDGGTAVGVPGNPMGLFELHRKYGKLKWKAVLEGPIRLAEKGFKISGEWVDKTIGEKERFNSAGREIFFKKDQTAYKPGEFLKQPDLARALKKLRDEGPKGFYQGEVAKDLASTVQKSGGVLDLKDLAEYKTRWLTPLVTSFAGHDVHLMPPPSSGGVVIAQALKLVERLKLADRPLLSVDEFHLLGEIQARAYRGRILLGDPDFVKNPLERLLNDAHLTELEKSFHPKKANTVKPLEESSETTHFSVMDAQGNAVALTYTLNGNYGSGVVTEKFKIALNNEMDDFTTTPGKPNQFGLIQGEANQVEPKKRPLSSMSPTLVLKDGKTVMALGAPGGPRIISAVFQVLYRVLGRKMDLDMAVQAPRVHHQYQPNILFVDRQRFSPEVLEALRKKGHQVKESLGMAKVCAIQRDENGILKAAFDSRGEGAAGGF